MANEALKIVEGAREGREIPLPEELLIGRTAEGDGRIVDPLVSRRHARIARTAAGTLLVADAGSSNGTFVNGQRVTSAHIAIGDKLKIGQTVLQVVEATIPPRPTQISTVPVPGSDDPESFRAQFPVFGETIFLNAGCAGPIPARAAADAQDQLKRETDCGRASGDYFPVQVERWNELRGHYAAWLNCEAGEVALTRATSDGVNIVLGGLDLRRGDEVITTDEEHPGVLAPLAAARERCGISIEVVPFDAVADAVTPRTRLVACSHVSWVTGRVVDTAALRATGVPVLLDGAQALGAIPVDVRSIGCDFYAASGGKWLCGPDRTGCLFVREDRIEAISPPATPSHVCLADPNNPLDLVLPQGARRFDPGAVPGVLTRWALSSLEVLEQAGIGWVTDRGPALAAKLAGMLREAGVDVAPRGASTLVSFATDDAPAEAERWLGEGVNVRDVPGRGLLRASIGAWCLESDLERVVELASASR